MTRRQKWLLVGVLLALGCGGVVATQAVVRQSGTAETDKHGNALSCIDDLALGGGQTCVLFKNGRVHCYGVSYTLGRRHRHPDPDPEPVRTKVRFSQIDAGHHEVCGLSREDGSIWCWGEGPGWAFKQGESRVPVKYADLGTGNVDVGVATTKVCALQKDASVWCQDWDLRRPEKFLEGARELFVRNHFGCAKLTNGEVHCFGNNGSGQLGRGEVEEVDVSIWEPAEPVSVVGTTLETLRLGAVTACGLTNERSMWCWGYGGFSLFADGRHDHPDEPVRYPSPRKPDESIRYPTPRKLELDLQVKDFAMGSVTNCVLTTEGRVWCWGGAGANDMLAPPSVHIRRGNSETLYEPYPRELKLLGDDNIHLWAGGAYCVQKLDLSVWCWGANDNKQVDPDLNEYEAPLTQLPVVCAPDE